jgi:hypothetical protein
MKEERKRFFFEKKAPRPGKQKTFGKVGQWLWNRHGLKEQKFFGSPGGAPFFQKRTACLSFSSAGKAWMPAFAGMTCGLGWGHRGRAYVTLSMR